MFWGIIVSPPQPPPPPSQSNPNQQQQHQTLSTKLAATTFMPKRPLHVTNCALGLGHGAKGSRVVVHCVMPTEEGEETDAVVCALRCGTKEYAKMDMVLEAGIPLRFYVEGPVEVHLTGYYIKSFLEQQQQQQHQQQEEEEEEEDNDVNSNDIKEIEEEENVAAATVKEAKSNSGEESEDVDVSVFYQERYRDPLGFGEIADEDEESEGVETYNEDVEKIAIKKRLDFNGNGNSSNEQATVQEVERTEASTESIAEIGVEGTTATATATATTAPEEETAQNESRKKKNKRKRKKRKSTEGSDAPKQQQEPQKPHKKRRKSAAGKAPSQQNPQPPPPPVYKTQGRSFYSASGKLVGVEACGTLAAPRKIGGGLTVQDSIIGTGPKPAGGSRVTLTYTVQAKEGGAAEVVEKQVFVFGQGTMEDKDLYKGVCGMHAGGRRTITKGDEKTYDVTLTMVA